MTKAQGTKLYWILAFIVTIAAAYYQRTTGPTYSKDINVTLEGQDFKFEFPRNHGGEDDCPVELEIGDKNISGKIIFRKYPTNNKWKEISMKKKDNLLKGYLPNQPPAGKLEYYIELSSKNEKITLFDNDPLIIRFKGAVPNKILVPHIIIMFLAMLLSNFTGIIAFIKHSKQRLYGRITLVLLFVGGLIFGPIVQFHAFGEFWTGFPLGWDLTDNKLLVAFIFWVLAVAGNWKKEKPSLTILAAVMLLLVYSIPHSMFGSELNHETGEVITGMLRFFLF